MRLPAVEDLRANAASSLANHSTSFATSSADGVAPQRHAFGHGVERLSAIIGVSMMPGCTEFTRMLNGPSSCAAPLVMPRTAHLVAP